MKWIGALFLVLASYFCGTLLAGEEGKRLKALDSLIGMLKYMRRRMTAERTPLYRILSGYEDSFLEELGFLPVLRSARNGISELWLSAISRLPVDSEINSELLHFGENLGELSLDEQILRLDSCLEALQNSRSRLNSVLPGKQKSLKTVCLLAGMLTAILLI